MSGALHLANNTWNKVGDDVQIGDQNAGGKLFIQGLNGTTGIRFKKYNGNDISDLNYDGNQFVASNSMNFSNIDKANIIVNARSLSYINPSGNAGIYAKKNINTVGWYPVVCMDTISGGHWQIGNYNNENLQFVYGTKANRDKNNNSTSIINLPSGISGTIYTTGNKPSYSDVGAAAANHSHSYLPLSGGTLTGNLTIPAKLTFNGWAQIADLGSHNLGLIANSGILARRYDNANNWVGMYASSFNSQSSRLVKENIQPITDDTAKKLLNIEVVSYDYIKEVGGEKNKVGMIAEDMLNIYPELVNVPKNYNEEKAKESIYNGNNTDTLSLDYAKFTPYLIKMVQIQQQEINELKELVKTLL